MIYWSTSQSINAILARLQDLKKYHYNNVQVASMHPKQLVIATVDEEDVGNGI